MPATMITLKAQRPAKSATNRGAAPAAKTCLQCGRTITWRKKWERDWPQVKYCSQACRRAPHQDGADLEDVIMSGLHQVPASQGVDLSQFEEAAAAMLAGNRQGPREALRQAARRLAAAQEIEWVQQGRVVDPSTAKGLVNVRRVCQEGSPR